MSGKRWTDKQEAIQKSQIRKAIREAGNITEASVKLGISFAAVILRCRHLGINIEGVPHSNSREKPVSLCAYRTNSVYILTKDYGLIKEAALMLIAGDDGLLAHYRDHLITEEVYCNELVKKYPEKINATLERD